MRYQRSDMLHVDNHFKFINEPCLQLEASATLSYRCCILYRTSVCDTILLYRTANFCDAIFL